MHHIFFFILLFNLYIFAEELKNTKLDNLTTRKVPRRGSIASLLFSNTTDLKNLLTNRTSATCRWLRGYKHQNKLCRKRKGLPEVLMQARYLAVNQCEEQFRYDRWNCSCDKNIFKKTFRETAFLHAITSAAVMYSVAKACSEGKLQNCRCAEQDNSLNHGRNWKWGGCGDNTKQARKITRKFLQLKQKGDGPQNVLAYNSIVGIKTVAESEMKDCKCHGVSASCVMKTCWKSLHPFNKIAKKLKHSYHNAIQHSPKNTIEQTVKRINKNPGKLLYMAYSPNFCLQTTGRTCKDTENCATLCCGRGFEIDEIFMYKHCHCRWQKCCFDVVCDTCKELSEIYICK